MGGSGGGSSSGEVSYPAYMETKHSTWLDAVAADMIIAQTGDSPYASAVAFDPDCVLAATNYIISLLKHVSSVYICIKFCNSVN